MAMIKFSSARVRLGTEFTDSFPIDRGVKQGDPLSPLLFNLVIEVLSRAGAARVPDLPEINGIPIPITLYADDTNLYSRSDAGIAVWEQILLDFQDGAGPRVHTGKSGGLNCSLQTLHIPQISTAFEYLGFNFDPQNGLTRDYHKTIEEVAQRLNKWKSVSHCTFTRMAILKSYALACLWFKAFLIGENPKAIQTIHEKFLWYSRPGGRKRTMVRRERSRQPIKLGGLSCWDYEARLAAFKANMIEKIRFNPSMKANAIWMSKLNFNNPDFWKPSTPSCLIEELIEAWKKFHKPGDDLTEYKSIKTLQRKWSQVSCPIWTEKQIKRTTILDSGGNLTFGASGIFSFIQYIRWRKLAFFAWKYFQGALVFPRSKCPCDTREKPNSQRHTLFHCPIGDQPWDLIAQFSTHFSPSPVKISDEKELWIYINSPKEPEQIKLALLCGIMARWHNRWTPPYTSSTSLWRDYINETASAELDRITLLQNEDLRSEESELLHQRWLVPELFKLKYTSLLFTQ